MGTEVDGSSSSSGFDIKSENWGISVESLPITQASTMQLCAICSVCILPYIQLKLHLLHFIVIVYVWNTSGERNLSRKMMARKIALGVGNKHKSCL